MSHWYDISDVGMEKLVKESLSCMRFCVFRLEDQFQIIGLYADHQ
ncbi:MAG: transposase [Flavobacteriales bacterium Tduv]